MYTNISVPQKRRARKQIGTFKQKNCCRTGKPLGYGFIHDARERYHRCHDMQHS